MTDHPATPTPAPDSTRRITQRGLWFEEMELGAIYEHRPGRTVTEADNVLFTTLTMNTQPLHLDQAASEQLAPFHDRLVNSMFTLSTLVGLSVGQLTQGTIVANLGFTDIRFPALSDMGTRSMPRRSSSTSAPPPAVPVRAWSPWSTRRATSAARSSPSRCARPW